MRKKIELDFDDIKCLYEKILISQKDIAKKYNISVVTLNKFLKRNNIIRPKELKNKLREISFLKKYGVKNISSLPEIKKVVSKKLLKSAEQFIKESNKIHNDKYDYSLVKYTGNKNKIKIICPIHGEFLQSPLSHLHGKGCPKCYGNKKLTQKEFIEKANEIHIYKYDYSLVEYKNIRTKIKIVCPKHGEFLQSPSAHLFQKQGCPICKESIGERKLSKIFLENNIKFETQKRFSSCRDKNPLPFDFYLPEHNICIEFQGKQHYFSYEVFGGEKDFLLTKKHDKIKKQYCKKNNINFLEIKYTENIEQKIKNFLMEYTSEGQF
ncbi:MAG: DUF723 domain-containing protein [Elusimicrobiota bacterium]|jgi:very-short-patch-repair endonuclease|nr:DUF723 domain-containing protein [Elusimicrobiota bacterium]